MDFRTVLSHRSVGAGRFRELGMPWTEEGRGDIGGASCRRGKVRSKEYVFLTIMGASWGPEAGIDFGRALD